MLFDNALWVLVVAQSKSSCSLDENGKLDAMRRKRIAKFKAYLAHVTLLKGAAA